MHKIAEKLIKLRLVDEVMDIFRIVVFVLQGQAAIMRQAC